MTQIATSLRQAHALLLPASLLFGLGLALVAETGGLPMPQTASRVMIELPQTVMLAPRDFSFRAGGDFEQNGVPVSSPLLARHRQEPLEIMIDQVSAADYAGCVAAGVCARARPRHTGSGNVPAAGVSFNDAQSYAAWLSAQTGEHWRLPSVEEWDFAADGLADSHGVQSEADTKDPSKLWLATFDAEAAQTGPRTSGLRPLGAFGTNALGVADLGGNVWEWTSTCHSRTRLDPAGAVLSRVESCGVRILEGRHRMAMSGFVQDARGGGCSMGVPPDNLGFRLVRDPKWYEKMGAFVAGLWRRVG